MARTVFIIFVLLLWSSIAYAEKRVALVIGNGAYQKVSKLPNPTNDAKAIAGMLRAANFDEVALHENLGIRELRRAIKDFSDLARDADTAVVYYSGHGIEVNGVNYLIPTDAVLDSDIDVPYEAYSLDNLVQVLEPARRLRLVILDACRDNPFARSMKRTIASRAVGGGLAPVEPTSVNTLIGFAAKAGSIALDGEGLNSPYTMALLNHIVTPGLDLRIAFGRVRDEVLKVTRNKQEPFVYGSLGGTEIALVSTSAPHNVAPITPSKQVIDYDKEMEIAFWNAVKDGRSKDLLQTYLERYPAGNFAGLAKVMIEQLDKEQSATRLAAERDSQAQLAEAARSAAEVKQAEELRKADTLRRNDEEKRTEELKRAEATARAEAHQAQDTVRKAEAERLAALKAAEDARREADAARAEQQRLARLAAEVEERRHASAKADITVNSSRQAARAEEKDNPEKQETKKTNDSTKVAVLPSIQLPRSSSNFDGSWTVHWIQVSGCLRTGDGTYQLRIKNGTIGGHAWSGRVSGTGEARWIVPGFDQRPVHYSGTFRGNSASGAFKRLDIQCTGKFTATRAPG
jgi:hypothetical protein